MVSTSLTECYTGSISIYYHDILFSQLVENEQEPMLLRTKARLLYGASKIMRQKTFFLYSKEKSSWLCIKYLILNEVSNRWFTSIIQQVTICYGCTCKNQSHWSWKTYYKVLYSFPLCLPISNTSYSITFKPFGIVIWASHSRIMMTCWNTKLLMLLLYLNW